MSDKEVDDEGIRCSMGWAGRLERRCEIKDICIAELESQLTQVKRDLREYGKHKYGCPCTRVQTHSPGLGITQKINRTCNCGFTQLLEGGGDA